MKIGIYQIDTERDKGRVKFSGLKELTKYRGINEIDPTIYTEVFSGEVGCENLEDVYMLFNTAVPPLHRGHSLSVSDIVATADGAYYCDSVGFRKVNFDGSKAQKPDNLLKAVYIEPEKAPYVAEVEDTLRGMQRAVGGRIELIDNGDGTVSVCNGEAKLIGLQGTRRIEYSVIAGPILILGTEGERFRSLTEEETEKYMKKFEEVEEIGEEEVKADTGIKFYPM